MRVQDPRVQNEGSWNSYVDYKIFLHVSASYFCIGIDICRGRGIVLRQNCLVDVFDRPETEEREGGEEEELGVCLRVSCRLPRGILLQSEPLIRTVA